MKKRKMNFPRGHYLSKRIIISISLCVFITLFVSGCRPNIKQQDEMEAAKQKAANAIQGAKSAIASAESRIKQAQDMAAKTKGGSLNDTWSPSLAKARELLAQAQGVFSEGAKSHKKASSGSVAKVLKIYAEAESLAKQSLEQANIAGSKAYAEYKRLKAIHDKELAEEKARKQKAGRLKDLTSEVRKYQGLLEKAIKSGDPFEVARLMVKLAEAELSLDKERLAQDLTDKAAVSKAQKRLADNKNLENRLKKAKADMEAAKRQYDDAKGKRTKLANKVEQLKSEIARLRDEIDTASLDKNNVEDKIKQNQ